MQILGQGGSGRGILHIKDTRNFLFIHNMMYIIGFENLVAKASLVLVLVFLGHVYLYRLW
jgi:hypothetical protein